MAANNKVNQREIVLDILMEVLEKGGYSHIVINQALKKYQYLDKQDRSFISRISEGTIEKKIELDYIINQFSKVKVNKMKPIIRNVLRMGVYQIKYMDSVPDSAACNEAVKLAVKRGFSSLRGFVNGVIRNIAREIDNVAYPDEKKEYVKYLSVKYSMPEWIVEQFREQYGKDTARQMLEGIYNDKKTTIRCNLSKTSVRELTERLEKQDITVTPCPYLEYALYISGYDYLDKIDAFREGLFQVQDISSMLVADIANPSEGDYVIDVCAAPGGKSLHVADMLHNTGHVSARDVSDYKVALIQENIDRTKSSNITAKVCDATVLDEESIAKADIVIADLPCSGLGVIGRKKDIKYKIEESGQQELVKLQRKILSVVNQYVRSDGTLIYSTCTTNRAENIDNVKWFIENYPFELVNINDSVCKELRSADTEIGYMQLLPGIHATDGFFIARFKRKAN